MPETLQIERSEIQTPQAFAPPAGEPYNFEPWKENGVIVRAPTADEAKAYYGFRGAGSFEDPSVTEVVNTITERQGLIKRGLGKVLLRGFGVRTGMHQIAQSEDQSLLGLEQKTDDTLSESTPFEFGYGNESERLESLHGMTFQSFKSRLEKMNKKLRKGGVDDAETDEGFTTGGRLAGSSTKIPHIYPDAKDINEVVEYAFNSAQQQNDVQSAALVLSGGFVAAHPFADGNGRVSRSLYSELSAGLVKGTKGYEIATSSSSQVANEQGGSRMISLGNNVLNSDLKLRDFHKKLVYERSGVEELQTRIAGLNSEQNENGVYTGVPAEALEGLDASQQLWIQDAYFNIRDITYDHQNVAQNRGEDESFSFALAYAQKQNPGALDAFVGPRDEGSMLQVDKLLGSGNKALIASIADGAREYYKQHALSYIDMLGDKGANSVLDYGSTQGRVSVRDRIVEKSNNFLAEKIGTKRTLEDKLLA